MKYFLDQETYELFSIFHCLGVTIVAHEILLFLDYSNNHGHHVGDITAHPKKIAFICISLLGSSYISEDRNSMNPILVGRKIDPVLPDCRWIDAII